MPFVSFRRRITGITRSTVPIPTASRRRRIASIPSGAPGVGVAGTTRKRSMWLSRMATVRGAETAVNPSSRTSTTFVTRSLRPASRTVLSVSRIHWLQPAGFVWREETRSPFDVTFTQAFSTRNRVARFDSTRTCRKFRIVRTEFTGGSNTAYVLFTSVAEDATRTRSYWTARSVVFTNVAVTLMKNTDPYIAPENPLRSTTIPRESTARRLSFPPETATRPRAACGTSEKNTPTPLSRNDPPSTMTVVRFAWRPAFRFREMSFPERVMSEFVARTPIRVPWIRFPSRTTPVDPSMRTPMSAWAIVEFRIEDPELVRDTADRVARAIVLSRIARDVPRTVTPSVTAWIATFDRREFEGARGENAMPRQSPACIWSS